MAKTMTKCSKCDIDIETEHVAGEEPIPDEICPRCELEIKMIKLLAKAVKLLEDKLPGNPDSELQELVGQCKMLAPVVKQVDQMADDALHKEQPELDGMGPQFTNAEIRAQELAAAQDQKDIVSERVKDRERNLLYAMHAQEVNEVKISDMTGLRRVFRLENLEKVKTKRGGNE